MIFISFTKGAIEFLLVESVLIADFNFSVHERIHIMKFIKEFDVFQQTSVGF
jgi:hypothetical protein